MFVRIKKINGHDYRYLVKSVRVDGKMKQKVIKYLGKVEEGENIKAQGCDKSGDPGAGR